MNNIQEHMDNVKRKIETLRKNQKEVQKIKNTVTEIEIFEAIMRELLNVNDRHQITDPVGNMHIILKLQKIKDKKKTLKDSRE